MLGKFKFTFSLLLYVLCAQLRGQSVDAIAPNVGYVYTLALQADGKILVGGAFTSAAGQPRTNLCRLNTDGTLDSLIAPSVNYVYTLAVQTDGKIVVGDAVGKVLRLNENGSQDQSFQSRTLLSDCYCIAQQADGKLLVGGFPSVSGTPTQPLLRLNVDGTSDTSFNPILGTNYNTGAFSVAIQPDGKLIVGGKFTNQIYNVQNLARLNPDGSFDLSFNPPTDHEVDVVCFQPDGSVVASGAFTSLAGQPCINLGRVTSAGVFDSTFAPAPNARVRSILLQADGRLIAGGLFTSIAGQSVSRLCRLNSDGTLDSTFSMPVSTIPSSLVQGSDGTFWIGGSFTNVGGLSRTNLARISELGSSTQYLSLTPSNIQWTRQGCLPEISSVTFSASTNGSNWFSAGTAVRNSGGWQCSANLPQTATIRAQGVSTAGYGNGSVTVIEADFGRPAFYRQPVSQTNNAATGVSFSVGAVGAPSLVFQWCKNGIPISDGANITGSSSPTLLLRNVLGADAGSYTAVVANSSGTATSAPAALGVIDPFITKQPVDASVDVGQTTNLSISVTGSFLSFQWTHDGAVIAGATSSTLPLSYVATNDAGHYQVIVANPYATITSTTATVTANSCFADPVFRVSASMPGYSRPILCVVAQPDGQLLLGGNMSVLDGRSVTNIARIDVDGSFDETFRLDPTLRNPYYDPVECASVQPNGKILIGGWFGRFSNHPDFARLNNDGSLDSAFNFTALALHAYTSAVQLDGKIVVGGTSDTGSSFTNCLLRVNQDGSLDTTFTPSITNTVNCVALDESGRILVGGAFTNVNGQQRNRIARLNSDGTLDATFNPGSDKPPQCLIIQPDGKILVSMATSLGKIAGQSRAGIARLNADGTIETNFYPIVDFGIDGAPYADQFVNALALQADGRILVGGTFRAIDGQSRPYLARLSADGSLDLTFNPVGGSSYSGIYGIALQGDGKIVAVGSLTRLGGLTCTNVARLNNNCPATQSFTVNDSSVTWLRGGSSPEIVSATFDWSYDGNTWFDLGASQRVVGGWQISGVSIPNNSIVRARGVAYSGVNNGCGSIVEARTRPTLHSFDSYFGPTTNGFRFDTSGCVGQSLIVEASTNLSLWTPLATIPCMSNVVDFVDSSATNTPTKFYRARLQ